MISVVLYGRNDNYGYNLHKRAALSFNCIAEVLTDPTDEILFVDYNTPNDFPTFPEAIQDTLTARARSKLRIFRVRPHIHDRFKSRTHLVALEPVARNVAIRRSSNDSRWILSTNTDMIFVPQNGGFLTDIVRDLSPGIYHAPRIEIPETLWESLDRSAAAEIIETVRGWGRNLYLNEIVLASEFIRYDGPGDFQLILRDDLFEKHGFDEEMLLGWHVDSNIARRMGLKYGQIGDLGKEVYGYHCDHTRQVTPAHSHSRVQNDWRRFVDNVSISEVWGQAESWGCANDDIEEIRLTANFASGYIKALIDTIGKPQSAPLISEYTGRTFNLGDYDPRHLLPFLTDMFASMPRTTNVGWFSVNTDTLRLFANAWSKLGFAGSILLDDRADRALSLLPAVRFEPGSTVLLQADVFVFDFGGLPAKDDGSDLDSGLVNSLLRAVRAERRRLASELPPRRFVALNAINNIYEGFVCGVVAAAATPYATHMRHGFVFPPTFSKQDWLPLLGIGEAGVRVDREIRNAPGKTGILAFGPSRYLDEGRYLISLGVDSLFDSSELPNDTTCVILEIRSFELLAIYKLSLRDLGLHDHQYFFEVQQSAADEIEPIEVRVRLIRAIDVAIRCLTIEPATGTAKRAEEFPGIPFACRLENWLPFLHTHPIAHPDEGGIAVGTGEAGHALYGPYFSLPPGHYELLACLVPAGLNPDGRPIVVADVVSDAGRRQFGRQRWHLGHIDRADRGVEFVLPFSIAADVPRQSRNNIETRIWTSGDVPFRIDSLGVRVADDQLEHNWFRYLVADENGLQDRKAISSFADRVGCIATTPAIKLEPGHYELVVEAVATRELAKMTVEVWSGTELIGVEIWRPASPSSVGFDVTEQTGESVGVEVRLRSITPTVVTVRGLMVERTSETPLPVLIPPVCRLESWLPFLHTHPIAHLNEDGIAVGTGEACYALYGPYLTLPPGHYELVACVVPAGPNQDGRPIVVADVVSDAGGRQFAMHKWRLGHIDRTDPQLGVEFVLPFTIAADVPQQARNIETRIWTPGDAAFHIVSLRVRFTGDQLEHNWFRYLIADENGHHDGNAVSSFADRIGCIAATPKINLKPGHYELAVEAVATGEPAKSKMTIEVWSGTELIGVEIWQPASSSSVGFDVTAQIAEGDGVEVRLRSITPTAVTIRGLMVERTSEIPLSVSIPAVCRLESWLPFLHTHPMAHLDEGGITVGTGEACYALFGPSFTLLPGHYELVASLAPAGSDQDGRPIVVADVVSDAGQRQFARHKWHLGHVDRTDPRLGVEFVLPFTIAADVPRQSRKIETRIWTTGDAPFHIDSLTVRFTGDQLDHNWSRYLVADENGRHDGKAISSFADRVGCIAATPAIKLKPGHYELTVEAVATGELAKSNMAIEIWSGTELIGLEIWRPASSSSVGFDVTEQIGEGDGVEVRLRSLTPTAVTIRGLMVEKTSETPLPDLIPAVCRLESWLPFLHTHPIAHLNEGGITVGTGEACYALYGPYWSLPPGRYEVVATLKTDFCKDGEEREKFGVTAEVAADRGKTVVSACEWKLSGASKGNTQEFRLPFELKGEVGSTPAKIETRLWTPGEVRFFIRSFAVRPVADRSSVVASFDNHVPDSRGFWRSTRAAVALALKKLKISLE